MIKAIELIVVVTLMIFSFVVGVKYSESVKNHAGWLFETKEEEVDLPDLTNEGNPDSATVYDSGAVDNGDQMPQEPVDGINTPENNAAESSAAPEAAVPSTTKSPAKSKTTTVAPKQ